MDDEFLIYLKQKIGERLITTVENIDLLLWGIRDSDTVRLLGLTLTIGLSDDEITKKPIKLTCKACDIIKIAQSICQSTDCVFFIIIYPVSGNSPFVIIPPKNPLDLSNTVQIQENQMPKALEQLFGTSLGDAGTAKPVNKSTSDWFHVWTRENLPRDYVKENIDGIILSKKSEPIILLETKRSYKQPAYWAPYQADSRNYYLQNLLAKKTQLTFWTIYHKNGVPVNDNSDVSLFVIKDVSLGSGNWISYTRSNISAIKVLEIIEKTIQE